MASKNVLDLTDSNAAARHVQKAIDCGRQSSIMIALLDVAQSQGGVAEVARKAGLARQATYRILSAAGNPELKSFRAILRTLGLALSVRPATGGKKM